MTSENKLCDEHTKVNDHIIKISAFMGEAREAGKAIKKDIDALFEVNRKQGEDIAAIREQLAGMKMQIAGFSLAGAGLMELGYFAVKKALSL